VKSFRTVDYSAKSHAFTDLSECLVTSRTASIYNWAIFFDVLLDFVPDESAVEAVRIATSKSDDHNLCGAIFEHLGALKSVVERKVLHFT